ncbi:hypothetical protein HOA59_01780 [archaeon]|jgi:hypothetical protein|nr:hypothetical protein [archaeon]MBT6824146.1 hypothetical protein [archaeon]MBT7107010.1 hypothetical protein [archaeon]MBT7297622.1 hypothetical protein [archaeon]
MKVLIVVLLIVGVLFLFNVWRSGAASTMTKEGLVALDDSGIPIKKDLFNFWNVFWNPADISDQFKWESEVVENELNVDLGVDIISFEKTKNKFMSGEAIYLTGVVEAASLKKDGMNVSFSCELEDYDSEQEVYPEGFVVYGEGIVRRQDVSCLFPSGIIANKEEVAKKVTLNSWYDFVTISTYRMYFMDSEILESFLVEGIDPFVNNKYHVTDSLLIKPANIMRSRITEGPIDIRLSSETSQPFSSSNNFVNFNVDLINTGDGNLKKVNSLKLYIPFAIEFGQDIRFCDFVDSGEIDGQFKIYEIGESALKDKVNVDCSVNQLYSFEQDCIDDYNDINLRCNFRVLPLPEGDDFFVSLIKAESDYSYEVKKNEVITIVQTEVRDICGDISDEDGCISAVGCMVNYDGLDFGSCETCPSSIISCEGYEGEVSCNNDVCGFSNCVFNDELCITS